jgi:Flp pilus assembly pilin Flp
MKSAGGRRLLKLVSTLGLVRNTRGQDLVEYAMLAGFVAVAGGALIPWGATGPISMIFSKLNGFLIQLGGA